MQQIVYDESPYIPLVYPLDLENANTGKWTGWVRANENKGAWWYNTQMDSYLAVHPATATAETDSGGSSTGLIVGIVVAVVVVLLIVVLLIRRRGGRAETEV